MAIKICDIIIPGFRVAGDDICYFPTAATTQNIEILEQNLKISLCSMKLADRQANPRNDPQVAPEISR